jgi:hypothetical protein
MNILLILDRHICEYILVNMPFTINYHNLLLPLLYLTNTIY